MDFEGAENVLENELAVGRCIAWGVFAPRRVENLSDLCLGAIAARADHWLGCLRMRDMLCRPWPAETRQVVARRKAQAAALAWALVECGVMCPHPWALCFEILVPLEGEPRILHPEAGSPPSSEFCLVCQAGTIFGAPPGWE